MIDTRTLRGLLGGAAMTMLLASAAHATDITPAAKQLAADAQKEGELVVSWSSSTLGGAKGAAAFQDGINKMFGTSIKISWAPGESMPNVGNQVATTQQNGLPSPTDVYIGFSRNMAVLLKRDLFLTAPWKDYLPDRLTDRVIEHGAYMKLNSATTGFSYNKAMAPSKPERMEDFLKPEWKGKFATTPFGAGFDQLAAKEAWGKDKTLEFAKKFSAAAAGFMRCNEMSRLASGEFLALVMDCSGDEARRQEKLGAPIGRAVSADIPLVSYFYLATPKNARHPNLGKLFMVYMATKEGQDAMRAQTTGDLHLYPESEQRDDLEALEKKYNFKYKDADIDWQLSNEEGNQTQQQVEKILTANEKK